MEAHGGAIAAGYSSSMRQSYKFNGRDSLTCKFVLAAYEIGTGNATRDGLRPITGVADQAACARLSLTDPRGYTVGGVDTPMAFISPAFDLLCSTFARYQVKGCRFHYCPQSGTNTTQRMVFAFAADPAHPLINATTAVTQAKLEAVTDSVPFAPWEQWSLDVTHSIDKKLMLFTYDGANGSSTEDRLERLSSFGVIGCQSSANGTATTGDVFGVLYMELTVEFRDFAPISVTRPTLAKRLAIKCVARYEDSKADRRSAPISRARQEDHSSQGTSPGEHDQGLDEGEADDWQQVAPYSKIEKALDKDNKLTADPQPVSVRLRSATDGSDFTTTRYLRRELQ